MDSSEFDAALGGTEHLPHTANSFKFAASRSIEIAAMTESILRPSKTKLIFQTLPVHMRRRVMSHNCKRLPRRLREGHLEQMKKSGLPPKQKRPSRKYRRRPANLLKEYTRRQSRIKWLETHIWHAKRFHMIERWGYRLAYRPCDKAFRACYRASSAHCLLQDISYYIPIKIMGSIEEIALLFNDISNKSCGLSISAKAYTTGKRAGSIKIFKPNSHPFGFIGTIEFLWVTNNLQPELWLFVHPSQIKEVETVFIDIINPSACDNENKKRKLNKYDVKFEVMYGHVNRFRLTGPLSQAVLAKTLKCSTDIEIINCHDWVLQSAKDNLKLSLQEKFEYWSHISKASSPSELPPQIIIGLTVKDPRWSRPAKRTKAVPDDSTVKTEYLVNIPEFASSSPIWNSKICDIIKENTVTNAKFIEHVTKTQLVPGEINEDDPTMQCIPIVLIQRPGSQNSTYKKLGYGSGWDIIIPSGYGLPFWLTFTMFGARSGGLRETESLSYEMGVCYLPPDSEAGKDEDTRKGNNERECYFKKPPSKRVNFIKLGIKDPFFYPWAKLLNDWSNSENIENYFILRDKHEIENIKSMDKKVKPKTTEPSEYVKTMRELWLPANTSNVRYCCIRETMGYITQGTFSFTEAKSCGIGYVAFNALTKLLETGSDKVLVRNTTSRKYRLATVKIINI
ncbi:unnamed protein product [Leptidea sinapis]|uniref:Uncharacterized protein n=1 Tax=Leptidea sinapis TaxID=189913 RepID=A0A5E4R1U4_9NEOP|nr:unnamed protein product [Leptidea sinapis]